MDFIYQPIDGYTQGQLPMAVGTSLTFEELAQREKDVKKYGSKVTQFRINIHTLVRNIQEAFDDETRSIENIVEKANEELTVLEDAVHRFFPKATVAYYVTELGYYSRNIPNVQFRLSKSPRMRDIAELEHKAIKEVVDSYKERGIDVERVERRSGHASKVAMVLTHLPCDLLCYNYYSDMFLIESHTGNIRERSAFSVKILPRPRREDAQFIPFNQLSLRVFGDGNKMLKGATPSITKAYLNLAKEKRWNYLTSKDKIISDINAARVDVLIDFFQ